jgi:hypothetical protein
MLYGGCIGDMDDFEGWAVDRTESDYDDIRKKCFNVICCMLYVCVYILFHVAIPSLYPLFYMYMYKMYDLCLQEFHPLY